MNKIRLFFVDDEHLALNLLEDFAGRLPGVEITGKFTSPMKALEMLREKPVDILFLDIQMPGITGTSFLRSLNQKPVTIFTTAYSEYASEAFDLDAADYLVKPFSFERFLKAFNKARDLVVQRRDQPAAMFQDEANEQDFITVKADGKLVRIFLKDILFIEGLKEYLKIVCDNNKYVVYERLKNLEEQLPDKQFLRVHKSFIVSIQKVQSLYGNMLEIREHRIPVSREKKEEVVKLIFG